MAVPTKQLESLGREAPYAAFGNVKATKDRALIVQVVGAALYAELEMQAAEAMEPDFPEFAILYPVLSFNTEERPRLAFYDRLDMGKMDEGTPDLRSWVKKLPADDGVMYQHAARLCRWT